MSDLIKGMSALVKRLEEMAQDAKHVEGPLEAAGEVVVRSIQQNFQAQGRPTKWAPLAASTLARRRKGRGKGKGPRILTDSARLKRSMTYKVVGASVAVGTNVVYARRHHYGFRGGGRRGLSRTPARPFMMLQSEDVDTVGRIFRRHIEKK